MRIQILNASFPMVVTRMFRTALACSLLAVGPAFAQKEFGFDNRKGSGQAYLKPEETVAKFKVPAEFEVKLFAGEPQLVNPVAFSIDERGRVWCVECFEYPSKTPKGKAPRDRIVILEDTDGDGLCDKRTVFCEGKDFPVSEERKKAGLGAFDLCTGLEVGHGGVWVGAAPYVWFIENKDDKPGKFETVLGGFGSQDTHETLNTFTWGPDGWLYGLHGVFSQSNVKPLDGPETRMNAAIWRLHPKTKKFEIFAEGTSNPWGIDFRNTDGQAILACCVIPHLYHIVPGGIYKRQAGASYNPYAYSAIQEISDHTFHKESGWAHAGLLSLDVPHMPKRFRNSVIFGSIHGCSLKQNILKPNGSSYIASRGDDFLQSGDKNFRPINMKWGPNGDIYLIDWHDQMPCHQAKAEEWDYERGRVYRIQLKDRKGKKAEDLGKKTHTELMKTVMTEMDPYLYRTALRMAGALSEAELKIAARGLDQETASRKDMRYLQLIASANAYEKVRLDNKAVAEDSQFDVFKPAELAFFVRMLPGSKVIDEDTLKAATRMANLTKVATVRRELASAAIRLGDTHDVTELVRALMKRKEDASDPLIPHLTWLAYEKMLSKPSGGRKPPVKNEKGAEPNKQNTGDLRPPLGKIGEELDFLAKEAPDNIFVRDQIVPKVMRRLVATGQPDDLALCLKFVKDVTDTNTREKALDGLTIALANQTVKPPAEWAALQTELRKEAKLRGLVNKLAVSFRDPAALKRAYDAAHDLKLTSEERAAALRDVVLLQHPQAEALIVSSLRQEQDLKVRTEAARQLAALSNPKLGTEIVSTWKMYPKEIHADIANSLAGRKDGAKALLTAMGEKKIDRTALTDNTVIKMQAFNDKEINALIEKAWGRTRPTPDELNKLIDKTRAELYSSPASFARGQKVFENQCQKCHQFEGKGQTVGPPLDGAARDIEYLLANVIDPNRVVGAPYFLRTANTLDGQAIQGLLAEEDDKFLTLKIENGVLKKIAKADLDGPVKITEKSMMPEGLTAGMTPQDFRDLLRYAMNSPYLTDVTVAGKPVSVGVPGRIAVAKGGTIEAKFTASKELKTKLLIGSSVAFTVELDGKSIGQGTGTGKAIQPDTDGFEVTLSAGEHTVRIITGEAEAVLYARFLDPERKLSYPEGK